MRVALIEPYYGGSHRAFADGYAASSAHDVEIIALPSSFWKWRMQGGFLTLAARFRQAVDRHGHFDAVIVSSMLDAARFAGAARRSLGDARLVVYMHENQLTYPTAPRDDFDATYAMANWASMTVADRVLFNSQFHFDEWFGALPGLLNSFPDHRHGGYIEGVRRRSSVLPVGVELSRIDTVPRTWRDRPLVLWNHRWEHDRGPDRFVSAIRAALAEGGDFDIALAGEQFISDPTGFRELAAELGDTVVHYGEADEDGYVRLLRSADVVVSTSRQEFFGVSVTEAVYAGAFPLLPNRMVYPERIPVELHDRCLFEDQGHLVERLLWATAHRDEAAAAASMLRPVMAEFDWSRVSPRLDDVLEETVQRRTGMRPDPNPTDP